jgi:TolB-like protein/class 3 adenylate cyclase
LSEEEISAPRALDLQLEIAHILLIDVVGYSKLLINEEIELLHELNQIVRSTEQFRRAESGGRLIRIPTGDGMALLFFNNPEEPVRCALEVSQALKGHPRIRLRMGVHSGPVHQVKDVNDRSNVAGAGINVAQRVMDCGDADHILLSKHIADDLAQYRHWQPFLTDLGEYEVKHGLRLHIVNLYKNGVGNLSVPEKLRARRWNSHAIVRPIVAHRWPTVAIFAAVLLSAAAVATSLWIFFHRPFGPSASENPSVPLSAVVGKSIAVMPFENLSDEKQNAYFADGIQDEILSDLAKVADLKVISRTSVMQYKTGVTRNLRAIAADLRVAHIVEGTVQQVGNRVKVSAQLIEATTDTHMWAEQYERDLADIFELQSEISEKIVAQLKARLSPGEKAAIEQRPTGDLVAYHLYLQAKDLIFGITFNARAKENLLAAVQLLEQAVARDPSFTIAYCQLVGAHDRIYFLGFDHSNERLLMADAALQSILRINSLSGEAHLAMAQHSYWGYRDYDRARLELAKAQQLLPNDPLIPLLTGYIDRREGGLEKSTKEMERALELDPRNVFILQQISFNYESLRRFREMAQVLDRVLRVTPKDVNTRVQRAKVDLAWRGDTRPLHLAIDTIIAEDSSVASTLASQWIDLAFCERDFSAATRALAAAPPNGIDADGFQLPNAWYEGLIARFRGDESDARKAFRAARIDVEKTVREQPQYAEPLSLLGMIDAALGSKEDAIREGTSATDLLPVSKDSRVGAVLIENLAAIYAWTGEKALSCERLESLVRIPSDVNYGGLKLRPEWDPLRGDPRFEKIVAELAPRP